MVAPVKPFFNGKDTQVWTVTMSAVQDHDDDKCDAGDNVFTLSMHLSPGGGYYWRIKGEAALDFCEMEGLKNQLDSIAQILKWGN